MTLQSDDEGEALFDSLADGDFSLSVSAEGFYEEIVEEISVTGPDEMEFAMTGVAIAEVVAETADLRSGPGGVYAHEGQIEEGDSVEIVSQNEAGDWYLVSVGDDDETAWVNGEDVSVSGSMDRVEVVAPPPTPTSAPAATAAQPTETESSELEPGESETTEEPEAPDTVVLYYISDPNEILGIFPVRPFDPAEELAKMQLIRGALYTMRDALPGARSGDAAACANYINAYNNVLYSGIYYDPVPPEWQDIDEVYYISFVYALDRTRPAYLSCVDSGRVDDFNAGLAEQSIGQTLAFLEPAINEAAARQ
jgi:uncharacterized protein YraI